MDKLIGTFLYTMQYHLLLTIRKPCIHQSQNNILYSLLSVMYEYFTDVTSLQMTAAVNKRNTHSGCDYFHDTSPL